jgi:hypothetical protein
MITKTKKGSGQGSSGRAPARQAQSPKVKPQYQEIKNILMKRKILFINFRPGMHAYNPSCLGERDRRSASST